MVKNNLDLIYRNNLKTLEIKKKVFKTILHNQNLDINLRWWAQIKGAKVSRKSSLPRIHNFCVQTGRSKSVIGYYKLSRLRLRQLASRGTICGLKKSSW